MITGFLTAQLFMEPGKTGGGAGSELQKVSRVEL